VIFLLSSIDRLDRAGAENLVALIDAVREAGYSASIANVSGRAFEALARRGSADAIGLDSIYASGMLALVARYTAAHQQCDESDCPLQWILPRVAELSLHPDGSLRDARLHGLALCQRIVAMRFDGPLNLATIGYFEASLREMLKRRPKATHVLIAAHTLAIADPIAAEGLPAVLRRLRDDGYAVALSGIKDHDMDVLRRASGGETLLANPVYPTQAAAIEALHTEAHLGAAEKGCPLIEVVERPA
jgi:MFS superfamily sulfate permease-like transporter